VTGVLLLLCGAALGWIVRRAEVRRLENAGQDLRERQHELELAHAALAGETERLRQEIDRQAERADRLQRERDDLAEARAALDARHQADREKHGEQLALLEKSREQLRIEFENLANRIFEERGRQLSTQNQQSIESLLKPFGEQIHRFQSRINEVHTQAVRGNETLAGELRNLMGVGLKMSDQAENLAQALKGDKKTTGNWGEIQLERTLQLAGLERGVHYEAQASFTNEEGRRRLPDFVIKLPDGKHLVIDSKVSLVAYDRAVSAETEEERDAALKDHTQALRRHIDDLASKDYTGLAGIDSPDLVFMFMPIEAAYIEALKYNRELFNDGYRKNVILVSHTTLLPMLRTVAGLWIAYRSNQEARVISEMAGDIYNKVCLVGQRLEDMGKTLNTATDKYNKTVTALVGKQGLYGKIERFRSTAANVKEELPVLTEQHPTIDHDRLGVLQTETEEPGDGAGPRLTAVDAADRDGTRD